MMDAASRLSLVSLISAGTLALVASLTHEAILEQRRQAELAVLAAVLPQDLYDNDLLSDTTTISNQQYLGSDEPQLVYRARLGGEPSAVAMQVTAADGYSGDIHFIVGIRSDGTVTGVRVLEHKETPGLGDNIDVTVSDWILQFAGLSLDQPVENQWAVKRDGGHFDQFTGATVTARATVRAIRNAQIYFRDNRADFFAADTREAHN
jgi:electron transport complex protein RnfG